MFIKDLEKFTVKILSRIYHGEYFILLVFYRPESPFHFSGAIRVEAIDAMDNVDNLILSL